MGKDSVKNFYGFLKKDASSVEELKKATKGVDTAEKAVEAVIVFAREKGFEFTKEDLAAFEEETKQELSVEDLDKINAGAWGLCWGFGIGWSDAEGPSGSETHCMVFGFGIGLGTKDYTEPKYDKK